MKQMKLYAACAAMVFLTACGHPQGLSGDTSGSIHSRNSLGALYDAGANGRAVRPVWQYYPRMYARFADLSGAASDVIHAIENDGYAVAETGGDFGAAGTVSCP